MTQGKNVRTRRRTLIQHWQAVVRKIIWRSDISPSAWIAETALIDRTWPKGIHIGAGAVIGEEAVVLSHDLTRGLYLDTRIGERTIIGPRAMILPGISVGADCIVAAGALVNRDMPDGSKAIGNPATITAGADSSEQSRHDGA
ncbi:MAG: DapH/DapD/GlmU-related protein [Sphingopyxis sp.]|uniref:acyltransferase n=1 Tax=Sphingopyxis sp. TaxID=1908224 RepID=UPI002ABBD639|nr:DapH/DapD/GlmU-related protein [Sphingopyxis sp.]MDZ3833687.1 DapH/DapD/GlmU-related protein [Sphingopyxis sp.]